MASANSMPSSHPRQDLKTLLECSVCLETFDDPRTLPCLHSFCKKCLERFVDGKREHELNCPVCRRKFTLNEEGGVAGMTRNHFICNMVEVLSIQHKDKCIPCSHCEQPSVGRCVTCELFMCEKCLQSHNGYLGFKDHVVLTMEELSKPENQSKIKGKSYCKKHPSKKLKLYCETCEELICTYCIVFEHVRPDHVCSPLEEIAERKREELKTICEILNSNESHNTQLYNELAITSMNLDTKLEEVKSQIRRRKNSVLKCLKDVLEKKAQSLVKVTENSARVKNQTIDREIKRISDHKAGQKKAYDVTKALIENGSNEEIMLSHKSVQQSVQNGEKGYERKEIDDKLPQYSDEDLDTMFLDEIKGIKEVKGTRQSSKEKDTLSQIRNDSAHGMFNPRPGSWDDLSSPQKLMFDASTGKLRVTRLYAPRNNDNVINTKLAEAGICKCEPV